MFGSSIHIAVADQIALYLARHKTWPRGDRTARLPDLAGAAPEEISAIAHKHPNYYALGAVGPDLFFFLPDFRAQGGVPIANSLIAVLEFIDKLYDTLDQWILE